MCIVVAPWQGQILLENWSGTILNLVAGRGGPGSEEMEKGLPLLCKEALPDFSRLLSHLEPSRCAQHPRPCFNLCIPLHCRMCPRGAQALHRVETRHQHLVGSSSRRLRAGHALKFLLCYCRKAADAKACADILMLVSTLTCRRPLDGSPSHPWLMREAGLVRPLAGLLANQQAVRGLRSATRNGESAIESAINALANICTR